MYAVSYMWYAVIGTLTCVAVGVGVGLATGSEADAFDERLLHPLAARLARRLPGAPRVFTERADKDSQSTTDTVAEPAPQAGIEDDAPARCRTRL